jgi:hypothetical protein
MAGASLPPTLGLHIALVLEEVPEEPSVKVSPVLRVLYVESSLGLA